ncbi:DUF4422 domain-containing protein [Sporolactobacillus sp. THM7-4]|nr:DUF4422 domain-containing protein [Sporolactobacillus sp. THM7-4]
MTVKIVVATHKRYEMPSDNMYLPIQVGKDFSKSDLGYTGDNTGINISKKNPNYCELTAMYWAWKNVQADYIGLAHYRRHFCNRSWFSDFMTGRKELVLKSDHLARILDKYDAVLPKKRHYWIETLWSHYEHTHNIKDLAKTKEIINRDFPEYINAFDQVMNRRSAHMFNMFIMKRDIFEEYSKWMFEILFKLEKSIDTSNYSRREARVFGYISELLLDVWLEVNQINYGELPVMFMEKQNWFRKVFIFLKAKFGTSHKTAKV